MRLWRRGEAMSSNEILVALRRIMRAIELRSKELEKLAGLTVPQLLVLRSLREAGKINVSELANQVSLSQGTATTIVQRLELKGLLRKEPSRQDRRMVLIELTESGRDKLAELPEMFQERFVEQFDKLEPWEQKMLTASVERIAAILQADDVVAAPIAPILQVGEIFSDQDGPK